MLKTIGLGLAALLVASVVLANYLTSEYGFISVGFGLSATAGTLAAGLVLGLRDLVHDLLGRSAMFAIIALGAAVSYLISEPAIAIASGVAFTVAELCDYLVYVPLRQRAAIGDRRWSVAVASSNIVGAIIDTVVFLSIAFGMSTVTATAVGGQLVGKTWATIGLLVTVWAIRAVLRQPRHTANL